MRWILLAGLAVVAACGSDGTTGTEHGTDNADLNFPVLAGGAPALCSDSAGAWFYKTPGGPNQEIALEFSEPGGNGNGCNTGETEDFLRLQLKGSSLLRFPDGTLIANGDSVFISVKWVGNDSILFVLQPSGLQFDPADPARLKIEYDHCDGDFNHDGEDDDEDEDIEQKLDIWRQEHVGDQWFPVGTAKIKESKEIEARLNGFSRFALAY